MEIQDSAPPSAERSRTSKLWVQVYSSIFSKIHPSQKFDKLPSFG
jgi:hypothetical protein